MKSLTTSRLFWLSGNAAMMILGLAGTASATPTLAARVPEIDPATAVSGLALLVGGTLLFIERHRPRRR
jgi:hypothetical protein